MSKHKNPTCFGVTVYRNQPIEITRIYKNKYIKNILIFVPCIFCSEQRNILHEIRKRKANWIGHMLRRNCLLKQVIKGNVKGEMGVTRRRGRRRKKLLGDLKDRRGYSHLKEEALERTMWRNRFGRGRILNE
jgi:FlaA1/EpsC-like NDP-sugar epimerase